MKEEKNEFNELEEKILECAYLIVAVKLVKDIVKVMGKEDKEDD